VAHNTADIFVDVLLERLFNEVYSGYVCLNVKKREERRGRRMIIGRKNERGRNTRGKKEEGDKSM
jgi:hypothetical protein